jgi:hypothetical protein
MVFFKALVVLVCCMLVEIGSSMMAVAELLSTSVGTILAAIIQGASPGFHRWFTA